MARTDDFENDEARDLVAELTALEHGRLADFAARAKLAALRLSKKADAAYEFGIERGRHVERGRLLGILRGSGREDAAKLLADVFEEELLASVR